MTESTAEAAPLTVLFPDVVRWTVDGGEVWLNGGSGEVEYRPSNRPHEALTIREIEGVRDVMQRAHEFYRLARAGQLVAFTRPHNDDDLPF